MNGLSTLLTYAKQQTDSTLNTEVCEISQVHECPWVTQIWQWVSFQGGSSKRVGEAPSCVVHWSVK